MQQQQQEIKTLVKQTQIMVQRLQEAENKRQAEFVELEKLMKEMHSNYKNLLSPYRQKKCEESECTK